MIIEVKLNIYIYIYIQNIEYKNFPYFNKKNGIAFADESKVLSNIYQHLLQETKVLLQ